MILEQQQHALLLIDLQAGLLNGPEVPYRKAQFMVHINQLIRQARKASVPIFFAQHTGPKGSPLEAGSDLWQLGAGVEWEANDTMFEKTRPSCFDGTALQARLTALGIERLVIAGMKTQFCVDTTCRAAQSLGFQPILVVDAHTCMDTQAASAEQIVAHHNATLTQAFAEGVQTADCLF